jgi:hypothetical protein
VLDAEQVCAAYIQKVDMRTGETSVNFCRADEHHKRNTFTFPSYSLFCLLSFASVVWWLLQIPNM